MGKMCGKMERVLNPQLNVSPGGVNMEYTKNQKYTQVQIMKSVFTYRQFAWHLNSFTDCAKLGITWCYVVSTGMMSSLCPNENVVTHLNCNCLKVYFHGRAVLSGETKSKTEECCARVKLKVLVFYHVEI